MNTIRSKAMFLIIHTALLLAPLAALYGADAIDKTHRCDPTIGL